MKETEVIKEAGQTETQMTPETLAETVVRVTPWWLISVGVHIVALLALTLISVQGNTIDEPPPAIISFGPDKDQKIGDLPQVPDLVPEPTDQALVDPTNKPNDDPYIYHTPDFEPSDHNETANDMDNQTSKGQSLLNHSTIWGDADGYKGREQGAGAGVYNNIGIGGGAGGSGAYGTRNGGGKKNLYTVPGVTKQNMDAVMKGLLWLARHQNEDGSWSAGQFYKNCSSGACRGAGNDAYDVGITAMAVWAFLCRGYTQSTEGAIDDPITKKKMRFGKVVENGIHWLVKAQSSDGCIGEKTGHFMYNHTIAALAIIEAYGMNPTPRLKGPAQRAVDFTIAAQNPGHGWRYSVKPGDNDSSVTGWGVMVLKSAGMSGLDFPAESYKGALSWYDDVTDPQYGKVGYTDRNSIAIRPFEDIRTLGVQPSLTAIGMMARIIINKKTSEPAVRNGASLLTESLPKWDSSKPGVIDFYYWYYGTLAMFQYDGPEGPNWRKWNEAMSKALLPTQATEKDGCKCGSWESETDRWGSEGGRVYATAINVLTLEIYYRYPHVFGVKGK